MTSVEALILVDMQTAFVTGATSVSDAEALLVRVRTLLDRARAADVLIVHLQNDGPPGAPDEPESQGWQLFIEPLHGEPVVRKQADDGFEATELTALLERRRATTIALCGVMSEMCVAATARGALGRGLGVVLPHDGHATYAIPERTGVSDAVPAVMAARVAEWSLGDQIVIPATCDEVRFAPPTSPSA
jgi:nicotinamidase-related amidase